MPRHHRTRPDADSQPQLLTSTSEPEWRIDDRTREVGRRGLAAARAALAAAARHHDDVRAA